MTGRDSCQCTCGKAMCASTWHINHGNSGYTHGCRCDICTEAATAHATKRQAALQAESLQRATKHKQMWTGPELEIATREDLTTQQAAIMLGRSFKAVQTIRRKCRIDPRKGYLLGAATNTRTGAILNPMHQTQDPP